MAAVAHLYRPGLVRDAVDGTAFVKLNGNLRDAIERAQQRCRFLFPGKNLQIDGSCQMVQGVS